MATNTKNLNLIKPAQEDFYNVDDFNENFQRIDDFVGEGLLKNSLRIKGDWKNFRLENEAGTRQFFIELNPTDGSIHIQAYKNGQNGNRLTLEPETEDVKNIIRVIRKLNGVQTDYKLYGEHNKPTANDVGAAPKSLVYEVASASTNEGANSILMNWFSSMGNGEIKNYILNLSASGSIFNGGGWFATIYKTDSNYGTIFMNKYDAPFTDIKVCSILKGEMGSWGKITPSGVVNASVE